MYNELLYTSTKNYLEERTSKCGNKNLGKLQYTEVVCNMYNELFYTSKNYLEERT
jgi:hypothetical protein